MVTPDYTDLETKQAIRSLLAKSTSKISARIADESLVIHVRNPRTIYRTPSEMRKLKEREQVKAYLQKTQENIKEYKNRLIRKQREREEFDNKLEEEDKNHKLILERKKINVSAESTLKAQKMKEKAEIRRIKAKETKKLLKYSPKYDPLYLKLQHNFKTNFVVPEIERRQIEIKNRKKLYTSKSQPKKIPTFRELIKAEREKNKIPENQKSYLINKQRDYSLFVRNSFVPKTVNREIYFLKKKIKELNRVNSETKYSKSVFKDFHIVRNLDTMERSISRNIK